MKMSITTCFHGERRAARRSRPARRGVGIAKLAAQSHLQSAGRNCQPHAQHLLVAQVAAASRSRVRPKSGPLRTRQRRGAADARAYVGWAARAAGCCAAPRPARSGPAYAYAWGSESDIGDNWSPIRGRKQSDATYCYNAECSTYKSKATISKWSSSREEATRRRRRCSRSQTPSESNSTRVETRTSGVREQSSHFGSEWCARSLEESRVGQEVQRLAVVAEQRVHPKQRDQREASQRAVQALSLGLAITHPLAWAHLQRMHLSAETQSDIS